MGNNGITYKGAIDILEEAIDILEKELKAQSDGYCEHLIHGGKGDETQERIFECMSMAIKALKKQIPGPPNVYYDEEDPYEFYVACRSCGYCWNANESDEFCYCPKCGQCFK